MCDMEEAMSTWNTHSYVNPSRGHGKHLPFHFGYHFVIASSLPSAHHIREWSIDLRTGYESVED